MFDSPNLPPTGEGKANPHAEQGADATLCH